MNFEDRILAILLQHPEDFKRAAGFLKKEAIDQPALKFIYSKMLFLLDASKKRTPPPIELLKETIMAEKPEDGANYVALVDRLMAEPLQAGEKNLLEHYVSKVHETYDETFFKNTLLSIADAVSKRDIERGKILLQRAAAQHSPTSASVFRGDLFADVEAELIFSNNIKNDPTLFSPIPTGLFEIDSQVGGIFKTEVGLIQAMPGGGKSTFLLQVAVAAMMAGKKVVVVTLEMSKRQYWWRFASRLTEVEYKKFKFGTLTGEDSEIIRGMFKNMYSSGSRIEIIHFPRGATAKDIENAILELPYEADLVVVDYLNRMKSSEKFGSDQNWLATGAAMEELCGMASSIYLGKGVGVWTGQQLKAGKEGVRNQTTSDAAFSALPGHHAHCVAYITNTKDGTFIGAAKWRDGKVEEFQIYPDFSKFLMTREIPRTPEKPPAKRPERPQDMFPAKKLSAAPDGSVTSTASSDADF